VEDSIASRYSLNHMGTARLGQSQTEPRSSLVGGILLPKKNIAKLDAPRFEKIFSGKAAELESLMLSLKLYYDEPFNTRSTAPKANAIHNPYVQARPPSPGPSLLDSLSRLPLNLGFVFLSFFGSRGASGQPLEAG